MRQDHYKVLGVPREANQDAIRTAYLRLVKEHHPDVCKRREGVERFKAIASAWEILGDESNRALYDEKMGDAMIRPDAARRAARAAGAAGAAGSRSMRMPPILQAFEFATHPKVLLIAVPTLLVGYMLFGGRGDGDRNIEKVDAWLNPSRRASAVELRDVAARGKPPSPFSAMVHEQLELDG